MRRGSLTLLTLAVAPLVTVGAGRAVIRTIGAATPRLSAHLQLLPQGLKSLLRSGITVRVTSNQPADGLATISISRREARRAHLRVGRGASVVIGRGTVSGVADGNTHLRARVARTMAAKLSHLRHLILSMRITLITAERGQIAIDATGNY